MAFPLTSTRVPWYHGTYTCTYVRTRVRARPPQKRIVFLQNGRRAGYIAITERAAIVLPLVLMKRRYCYGTIHFLGPVRLNKRESVRKTNYRNYTHLLRFTIEKHPI